MNKNMPLPSSH